MLKRLHHWARLVRSEVAALYLAGRDPRTPFHAKIAALAVVAYALSPIDLIPDFVPLLGYLDDLLIVPVGIVIARSLMPRELMAQLRRAASSGRLPTSRSGAAIVFALWFIGIGAALCWQLRG